MARDHCEGLPAHAKKSGSVHCSAIALISLKNARGAVTVRDRYGDVKEPEKGVRHVLDSRRGTLRCPSHLFGHSGAAWDKVSYVGFRDTCRFGDGSDDGFVVFVINALIDALIALFSTGIPSAAFFSPPFHHYGTDR